MSFIPITPAGTPLTGLAADTFEEAKKRLMVDAVHMPYKTWEHFIRRGYRIEESDYPAQNPPEWYGAGGQD